MTKVMPSSRVVICGGAVMDCIVRPSDIAQRGASRTSMPGSACVSLGGVGRNIAEVLTRLGCPVSLLSAIGDDEPGRQISAACQSHGIGVAALSEITGKRTATFTALLDGGGDLVGAVADMDIFDEMTPEFVERASAGLRTAELVVCDANLPAASLERALSIASGSSVPAWFEPVSVAKAPKGCCHSPWHLTSPNWDELLAMLGRPPAPLPEQTGGGLPSEVVGALAEAVSGGLAEHILLTMGSSGAVLASSEKGHVLSEAPSHCTLDVDKMFSTSGLTAIGAPAFQVSVERSTSNGLQLLWYRPQPLEQVRDTTGAGDSLLAGSACAFAAGWPLEKAVLAGMFCAHVTLFVDGAVPQCLCSSLWQTIDASLRGSSRSRL